MVTPQPRRNEAKNEPSRAPTRTTGSGVPHQQPRRSGEDRQLTKRIVDTKVETTVDDDTNDGGDETTVETGNTITREGLPVDVDEAVELTRSSALSRLGVVGKTSTGVVERVHEEQGRSTSGTTRGDVAAEPLPVAVLLLETEQGLEVVLCKNASACMHENQAKSTH